MKALDLESLRDVFSDKKTYIVVAKIEKTEMASDKSVLRAQCKILTQNRSVVARVTWDSVGPEAGFFQIPQKDDLVLLAFAEGDDEQVYLIRRLSSKVDKIPAHAASGDSVLRALSGKKLWLNSTQKIYLSKLGTAPTENLVLGQVLKTLLSYVLGQLNSLSTELQTLATTLSTHTHIGNLGAPTAPPTEAASFVTNATNFATKATNFNTKKASPVDDALMLSDLAYTEK